MPTLPASKPKSRRKIGNSYLRGTTSSAHARNPLGQRLRTVFFKERNAETRSEFAKPSDEEEGDEQSSSAPPEWETLWGIAVDRMFEQGVATNLFKFPKSTKPATGKTENQKELKDALLLSHYSKQISGHLMQLAELAESALAFGAIAKLLNDLTSCSDALRANNFSLFSTALHDALASDDKWCGYSRTQYKEVAALFKEAASGGNSYPKISRAIMHLEALGFNTTPFELYDEEE